MIKKIKAQNDASTLVGRTSNEPSENNNRLFMPSAVLQVDSNQRFRSRQLQPEQKQHGEHDSAFLIPAKAEGREQGSKSCREAESHAVGGSEAPPAALGRTANSHPVGRSGIEKSQENRARRYALQKNARKILISEGQKVGLKFPDRYSRTAQCCWVQFGRVTVNQTIEHGKAHFNGLVVCSSFFSCPCCSAVIGSRRSKEVEQIIETMQTAHNKKSVMISYTYPHTKFDKLKDLRKKFTNALMRFHRGRSFDEFRKSCGVIGHIKNFEVTIGPSGFHLHSHMLMFMDKNIDMALVEDYLKPKYKNACIRAGLLDPKNIDQLENFDRYGLDIKDNCSSTTYLTKFGKSYGIDKELTLSNTKKGRLSTSRHPFELLESDEQEDKDLYLHYHDAMKGCKSLMFSRGLRKICALEDDKTDEELIEEEIERSKTVCVLSISQWKTVLKKDDRAKVLNACELGGLEAIKVFFKEEYEIEIEYENFDDFELIDTGTL